MKRASQQEIARRKEVAQRKGEVVGAIIIAAIPLFGAFIVKGMGNRLAMVAESASTVRWIYRGLFLLLLVLPFASLWGAMLLAHQFHIHDDTAVMGGWILYIAGVLFAALTHVRIARALGGVPQD